MSELNPAISWKDALLRINELTDEIVTLKQVNGKLLEAAKQVYSQRNVLLTRGRVAGFSETYSGESEVRRSADESIKHLGEVVAQAEALKREGKV